MATPDLIDLSGLLDDAECFAVVRQQRWPEGVRCPGCDSEAVIRDGCDDTHWPLLRSWLRPHRGISQDKLPDHLGFFQFVHDARRRGKALLGALISALVADPD